MLCVVFSLCYVQSLVCVMCSLQSRASSLRSEHASLRSVGKGPRAEIIYIYIYIYMLGAAPIHQCILGPAPRYVHFSKYVYKDRSRRETKSQKNCFCGICFLGEIYLFRHTLKNGHTLVPDPKCIDVLVLHPAYLYIYTYIYTCMAVSRLQH